MLLALRPDRRSRARRGGESIPLCVALGIALLACAATPAARAHDAAEEWNAAARPTLGAAYLAEQRAAYRAACSAPPCDAAPMAAAVAAVRVRWAPVYAAAEATRDAHTLWRIALEQCRTDVDAGGCAAVTALGADFAARDAAWRCAVRALGNADLTRALAPAPCGGAP